MSISAKGFDVIRNMRNNVQKYVDDELVMAVNKSALYVEKLAKPRAPFKTGTLRRSIAAKPAIRKFREVRALVGTILNYAPFQEYGRSRFNVNFTGRFYMTEAIKNSQEFFRGQVRKAMEGVRDRIMKR